MFIDNDQDCSQDVAEVNVPELVGVPVIAPFEELRVSPSGREPVATEKVFCLPTNSEPKLTRSPPSNVSGWALPWLM